VGHDGLWRGGSPTTSAPHRFLSLIPILFFLSRRRALRHPEQPSFHSLNLPAVACSKGSFSPFDPPAVGMASLTLFKRIHADSLTLRLLSPLLPSPPSAFPQIKAPEKADSHRIGVGVISFPPHRLLPRCRAKGRLQNIAVRSFPAPRSNPPTPLRTDSGSLFPMVPFSDKPGLLPFSFPCSHDIFLCARRLFSPVSTAPPNQI